MSVDDVLAAIDAEIAKCICGEEVPADGPSLDYCSDVCQYRYTAERVGETPSPEYTYPLGRVDTDGRRINAAANEWFERSQSSRPESYGVDAHTVALSAAEDVRRFQAALTRTSSQVTAAMENFARSTLSQAETLQALGYLWEDVVPQAEPPQAVVVREPDRFQAARDAEARYAQDRTAESLAAWSDAIRDVYEARPTRIMAVPEVRDPSAPTAAELDDGLTLATIGHDGALRTETPALLSEEGLRSALHSLHTRGDFEREAEALREATFMPTQELQDALARLAAAGGMSLLDAAQCIAPVLRAAAEPEPTGEEFRARALEARQNRGTGPTRRDNRRWRNR